MSFIIYLVKVSLATAVFLLLYRTVLRRLTFFGLNRFYLLGSLALSFLLPLCAFDLKGITAHIPAGITGIDWGPFEEMAIPGKGVQQIQGSDLYFPGLIPFAYFPVSALLLLFSGWKILRMFSFSGATEIGRSGRIRFLISPAGSGSFTVMRCVYLDARIFDGDPEPVRQHEMVHARQLHSLDLIWMEFAIALLWFNPFVFLFRRYVSENHEFLADSQVRRNGISLEDYLLCLKAETVRRLSPAIASYFKSSTLKKRIIMLTNKQSSSFKKWLYLLVMPVSAVLLMAFSDPSAGVRSAKGSAELTTTGSLFRFQGSSDWNEASGLLRFQGSDLNDANVPSIFPLDEKYRSQVTWGYDETRIHPFTKQEAVHKGMDIRAPRGTPVYASADGSVVTAEFLEGWGKLVVIQHGEHFTTHYAHLDEIKVGSGDEVRKGEVIGTVGNTGKSTGDHLHYEVRKDGEHVDPGLYFK